MAVAPHHLAGHAFGGGHDRRGVSGTAALGISPWLFIRVHLCWFYLCEWPSGDGSHSLVAEPFHGDRSDDSYLYSFSASVLSFGCFAARVVEVYISVGLTRGGDPDSQLYDWGSTFEKRDGDDPQFDRIASSGRHGVDCVKGDRPLVAMARDFTHTRRYRRQRMACVARS